jgi:hypothetical protein
MCRGKCSCRQYFVRQIPVKDALNQFKIETDLKKKKIAPVHLLTPIVLPIFYKNKYKMF